VKLPALPRRAFVAKPSGTAPKPPDFALRAPPRSPLAIPPLASARGILAKASVGNDLLSLLLSVGKPIQEEIFQKYLPVTKTL